MNVVSKEILNQFKTLHDNLSFLEQVDLDEISKAKNRQTRKWKKLIAIVRYWRGETKKLCECPQEDN